MKHGTGYLVLISLTAHNKIQEERNTLMIQLLFNEEEQLKFWKYLPYPYHKQKWGSVGSSPVSVSSDLW